MTLILSALTGDVAFQVADRQVSIKTRSPRHPFMEYDPQANKNIVLLAADSLVTIGYTGLAYMPDYRPTDSWIAEQITGVTSTDKGCIGTWRVTDPMFLQAVCDRLIAALNMESRRLPAGPMTFVIAGIQRRRNDRAAPLLWWIARHPTSTGAFQLAREDLTTFRRDREYRVNALGSIDRDSLTQMHATLRGGSVDSRERFRDALVECVRDTHTVQSSVGRDCMSIMLDCSPGIVNVDVEYVPHTSQTIVVSDSTGESATIPAAYSPYVIAPNWIWSPSIIEAKNDAPWHLGPLQVRFRAPLSPRRVTSVSGQPRKRAPGWVPTITPGSMANPDSVD